MEEEEIEGVMHGQMGSWEHASITHIGGPLQAH